MKKILMIFLLMQIFGLPLLAREKIYKAHEKNCELSWSVAEHKNKNGEISYSLATSYNIQSHQKECPYTFAEQLPLHRKILKKLFRDRDAKKFSSLTWGQFGNNKLKDWDWNIAMALASAQTLSTAQSENQRFVEIANRSNVYANLKNLFHEFHLDVSLRSVEKVFQTRAKTLPFYEQLKERGLQGNPLVMYDIGGSWFAISPM